MLSTTRDRNTIISSAAQILLARSIASESKTVYRVFVWQDYKRLYAGGKIDFLKVSYAPIPNMNVDGCTVHMVLKLYRIMCVLFIVFSQ